MKLVVAAVRPTPILWGRASGLASPTEVPASTLPERGMAPVRANIASSRVVLPLWKGPTSAMHRGPRGLLTSCPISPPPSCGARPVIGSANGNALPVLNVWQARKIAAVRRRLDHVEMSAAWPKFQALEAGRDIETNLAL